MPKKRQSQPMQVWLSIADHRRLQHAAKTSGRSQSDIAREGILQVLQELEKADKEKVEKDEFFSKCSDASKKIVFQAHQEAELLGQRLVGSQHLLLALANDSKIGKLLTKFGAPSSLLHRHLERTPDGWSFVYAQVTREPYSPRFVRIMDRARLLAKRMHDKYVQPEHLFLSLLAQGNGAAYEVFEYIAFPFDEARDALMKQLPAIRKERRWRRKGH